MPADTEVPPIVEMTGITIRFPGRARPRRRRLPPPRRRDPLAHGRERRRQVDAHQGAHRRVPDRQRRRSPSRRASACFASTADAQAAGHLDRLPGSQPLREPLGRRERDARPRAAQRRAASTGEPPTARRLATSRTSGCHRHPLDALEPLDRHPAARRHQPRDGARREGAHPRRADLQPRPGRGRAAVRRHARPPRPGRRDPLRQPLPRPGLRGLGPHHRPAQRPAHRRVPRRRPPPRGARHQDDRPRARRARGDLVDDRARDRPHRTPVLRATGIGRRGVLEPADIDVYEGEVVGIAGLLGSGRTELVRLLYGADRADSGQHRGQRRSPPDDVAAARDRHAASPSRPRTAGAKASSAT